MAETLESDTGLGLALVFGVLTLGAAAYMPFVESQQTTAYGFAAAVTFAVLTVGVLHLYWR